MPLNASLAPVEITIPSNLSSSIHSNLLLSPVEVSPETPPLTKLILYFSLSNFFCN